ncbi:phage holin family protein [Sphingomonas sabuli]|uniref:Phage holin family protein n=1 Tax=Sphingomonas sabuli TaxID=2764186 RepID=A0A7G9L4M2_9SPHN|nr:phage holin family protein [Sphingomonas sabuli]QNM83571.1 phage holin family protein [Sphingomonas sabuli]
MLKPADPSPPHDERPIGAIVSELVDEGKVYARAEAEYAKAIAAAKAKSYRTPVMLFVLAGVVGLGAVNALCIAIFVALSTLMSPLLAGLAAFVLIGAVAAGLGWLGAEKLRKPS